MTCGDEVWAGQGVAGWCAIEEGTLRRQDSSGTTGESPDSRERAKWLVTRVAWQRQ